MRAAKATGSSRLLLDDGVVRTVAMLTETRLAVFLGGRQWVVDIVPVQCLQGRVRHLLKCPRAHEGNFQSLYFRAGELACRHCHKLRYLSNLAPNSLQRARLKRDKKFIKLGGKLGDHLPARRPGRWRRRYSALVRQYRILTLQHYEALKAQLTQC